MNNVTLKLSNNTAFEWTTNNGIHLKGYFFNDNQLISNQSLICKIEEIDTVEQIQSLFQNLSGSFVAIIDKPQFLCLVADKTASSQLFYRQENNSIVVTDDIYLMPKNQLVEDAKFQYTPLGFVLSNKTLYEDVSQLTAGQIVVFQENIYQKHNYFTLIQNIETNTHANLKLELKQRIQNMTEQMAQIVGNTPVALSLSAGYDSRLVAYMLKKAKIDNVLCFTFGAKESNPEIEIAQDVARKLNFQWQFIDYSNISETNLKSDLEFRNYCKFAMQASTKVMFTPFFAAKQLLQNDLVSRKTIVMSGLGGDTFSGKELRRYMKNYKSLKTVATDLAYENCRMVKLNKSERKKVSSLIASELYDCEHLFQNIENWMLLELYPKFLASRQRVWEFFGCRTYTPFNNDEFVDFFSKIPFEYRLNQKLYIEVINELFEEFDMNYPKITVNQQKLLTILKVRLKRLFPALRKNNGFDIKHFEQHRFYSQFLDDINSKFGSSQAISYNGIFAEWLLTLL